jgi:uncharacterized Tic20 family protein
MKLTYNPLIPWLVFFYLLSNKSKVPLVKNTNPIKESSYMKLSFQFWMLLTVVILIISCSKHISALPPDNSQTFTATVGSSWKYIVFDSLKNSIDTQTVVIFGLTKLKDGRTAKIVKSSFSFSRDTTYSYLFQDTNKAIFYDSKDGTNYNKIYVFPLKVNSSWLGENILDTNRVTSNENITVGAGNFNSYLIVRNFKVTNVGIRESEWFCPGVGMIQRNYYERNIGFIIYKHYELISYYLAK